MWSRTLIVGAWLLWLSGSRANAQVGQAKTDSLRSLLTTTPEDTNRVFILTQLGKQYVGSNPDSTMYFQKQAEGLSRKMDWTPGLVMANILHMDVMMYQGKYDQALQLSLQALPLARKTGQKQLLGRAFMNIGSGYYHKVDYEKCLEYYLKGLAVFEEVNHEPGLRVLYANLSALYGFNLSQYEKGIIYGKKALKLCRKSGDTFTAARSLINMGVAYTKLQQYSEALEAYAEALQIGKENNQLHVCSSATINTALIYQHQGQYSRAIATYHEALGFARAISNAKDEVLSLEGLGKCYLYTKNYLLARGHAQQAIDGCRRNNFTEFLGTMVLLLSDIELAQGNTRAYLRLRAEADSLREQVWNARTSPRLQELEARFESQKKENQITALRKERQIQRLHLRQQHTWNYLFLAVSLSLLSLSFLFYRGTRQQKTIARQTEKLQAQRIRDLERDQQLLAVHSILQGQEAERRRLAKDLHDGLGGMLSGIKLLLDGLKNNRLFSESDTIRFLTALEQLDGTIHELRRVAHNMMPEALTRYGLVQALHDFCNNLGRSAGLRVDLQHFGLESRLEADTEIMLYRIGQELLNNVVKHARATEVLVQLMRSDNHITLTVEDNGQGFEVTAAHEGMGLSSVRSRVQYLGGNLDIHSTPGIGTTVSIDFCPPPGPAHPTA